MDKYETLSYDITRPKLLSKAPDCGIDETVDIEMITSIQEHANWYFNQINDLVLSTILSPVLFHGTMIGERTHQVGL